MKKSLLVAYNKIQKRWRKVDRYNQLRSGETRLAIEAFSEGLAAGLELNIQDYTRDELELIFDKLDKHFDQYAD
ncbi:hypothetical protein UFOVP410_156 [uncultured Caudovirales phage]|uniref:Uncharacterized protein n=1 Tax=uncultured Caudovirales phage TaxID=2100421 RepID=A0A6J5M706_9CAUD|nr:hypothetical protein UFOVP410_156 [uncultured Caudovirales phage]